MNIIINELSLNSQFESCESFYISLQENTLKILKIIETENINLLKTYNLFQAKITEEKTLYDALVSRDDRVTRFKSLLHRVVLSEPYWEIDQLHDSNLSYFHLGKLVTGTGLAEAYARECPVVSFVNGNFLDELEVVQNESKKIANVQTPESMNSYLRTIFKKTDLVKFCMLCFDRDKLSFEKIQPEYGFEQLEQAEIEVVLSYFAKFCSLDWTTILKSNKPLFYKKYQPSSKDEDWFSNSEHADKDIDKFRLGYTHQYALRGYGFRSKDTFYLLRIEKGHDVSDKG